jgi:hypothetical protein
LTKVKTFFAIKVSPPTFITSFSRMIKISKRKSHSFSIKKQ